MHSENKFVDDFVKLMNGAAGTIAGMGREAESSMREHVKEWLGGSQMVSREEFEAVKAMAASAKEEIEALKAQIKALKKG